MNAVTLHRILYVEDDIDIQEVTKFALENVGGFAVTLAESGAEAIRLATAEPPDLLLLDVMMPEMDGPTTLARLREDPRLADIPVIFITASVAAAEVRHLRSLGAIEVIAKPFDPMTLSQTIKDAWAATHP